MPNAVELVKKAAVEAVEAGKPVSFLFGEVISENTGGSEIHLYRKNVGAYPECN